MKRGMAILLTGMMVFALASCGKTETTTSSGTSTGGSTGDSGSSHTVTFGQDPEEVEVEVEEEEEADDGNAGGLDQMVEISDDYLSMDFSDIDPDSQDFNNFVICMFGNAVEDDNDGGTEYKGDLNLTNFYDLDNAAFIKTIDDHYGEYLWYGWFLEDNNYLYKSLAPEAEKCVAFEKAMYKEYLANK